ncbi:MAG: FtsX-like permease family protein [candidate division KSB1 bacterium]|nr:FtsX-like permease family protein [candidate division KSB1 bacterium]MDZ7274255.1 FtsX-like permease family protein [candidate division KSB1 bacterium]MDZ7287223.1 FtsX-like permease family protein [candidate division KSB1 bacterium]MDZ7296853.1 FtsX-like permease family protein [candidate division KSB1 bacterium]MDZ7306043.1 FtsX-like permease family protein [candidate division KSB1 bacterium]
MFFHFKLAWRNLFRNRRRSLLSGTAIGMGLAALIFVDALVLGMERNLIESATASFLGEGQIHRAGFRTSREVALTVNHAGEVLQRLQQEAVVAHAAPRVLAFGMITSPANVSAVTFAGIDPLREPPLSQIDEALVAGDYFRGRHSREIIIGSKLAELLEVGLDDRVVLTAARAPAAGREAQSGDLAQEMFRIAGIFHFNIRELDAGMVFLRLEQAQQLLGLAGGVHEIALKFTDARLARDQGHPFWQRYSQDGNEAVGWPVLLPQLQAVFELSAFGIYLTGLILFGVVALGIINTLFMALYERLFEFGVLRALGTRPGGMAALIICEAGALAILSIGLGCVLSLLVTGIVSKSGIDYTGVEYAGVTFRKLLYPVMTVRQYLFYPFWVFVFTALVAGYPALHAARLKPAEAMRRSL